MAEELPNLNEDNFLIIVEESHVREASNEPHDGSRDNSNSSSSVSPGYNNSIASIMTELRQLNNHMSQWKSGMGAQEVDRNLPKKIRKISDRNTASMFQRFRCFPPGYVDFLASFLQDPVAGIIDLGKLTQGMKKFTDGMSSLNTNTTNLPKEL